MNTLTILSKKILSLCGIVIISYATLSAQEDKTSDFSYQINRVQKYISISPAQLDDATTLSDLNQYYKSDWVKEYKSVKIIVISNGQKKTVTSSNDELTKKQKQLIESADLGSNIKVIVQYLPDNNLSKSEIQEMDFAFKTNSPSMPTKNRTRAMLVTTEKYDEIKRRFWCFSKDVLMVNIYNCKSIKKLT